MFKSSTNDSFFPRLTTLVREFVNQFRAIDFNPKFNTLANEIVDQIKSVGTIKKAKVIVNFAFTKGGYVKASLDLIGRVNDEPYINEGFTEKFFEESKIPQYIIKSLKNNELKMISLKEDDLIVLYDIMQQNLETIDTTTWSELEKLCNKISAGYIELSDKVFFTVANVFDKDKNPKGTFKIGILNDVPKEFYDKLYPFKECTLQL